ncbi:Orcinol O-methyltransferase [Heracleum sosnowskyi]|uniref:Orcinol O-methyltransferase n=1 Tax=Heracleum sosnowskyi TaxID=360622 RepID=A0AAD8J254_9APIA|nr:Orcinol O-methyltransferase [Heracleum sosnowskyi]
MDLISEEARELFKAQAHVWNHMFNFINSMSLNCAIQLDIPDVINKHGKPMTLSDLVHALSINKAKGPCIYRLMRILVHSGFFQISQLDENKNNVVEEGYVLTPSSRLLLKDEPLSIRPLFKTELHPLLITPWHSLSQWFTNKDATSFETAHGKMIWDRAGDDPNFCNIFDSGMASDTYFVSNVITKECRGVFEKINTLVDVGGGTGTLAMAIADAFPHLICTVFDLPHVVADLEDRQNLTFVGGNLFQAIPCADAVLFKWILHCWSDEECLTILSRCKESIPSKENGGKVIIIDIVVDGKKGDHTSIQTQLLFDMLMMVNTRGKERTQKEWEELFKAAGYSDYKITPILGLRSLIEVFP